MDPLINYLVKKSNETDMQVEIVALFSALNIRDFDHAKLAKTYNVMDWLMIRLKECINLSGDDGAGENDDLVLEIVKWIGTMAEDEGFLPMVVTYNVIPAFLDIMASNNYLMYQ